MNELDLIVLTEAYSVAKLESGRAVPEQVWQGGEFVSVTRTAEELSMVCASRLLSGVDGLTVEHGWRALKVAGPLDFALVGILAGLTAPLAAAGVSLFAVSTFDTDYLLVKEEAFDQAVKVLAGEGHRIVK